MNRKSTDLINYLNVKQFGAVGDGQKDDFSAIKKAGLALTDQHILYFPAGTYRIQTRGNLIEIEGVSNIAIFFETEAVLLMDNLNDEGAGSGHAFYFKGPAENLTLEGISIKWKRPKKRSHGDGIRIDGPFSNQGPSADRTFKHITIKNCSVENSPQTGMILMGCSHIHIENIDLKNTHADGVHLNACQHFTVSGVRGEGLGDDNVALVTYYNSDTAKHTLNNKFGPNSRRYLGVWSNYNGLITNVESVDRRGANGIRVSGALDVKIFNVRTLRRKAGIIVDAGRRGGTFGWSYQASRSIDITNVTTEDCHVGIHIMSFNVNTTDNLFWNFDVTVSNAFIKNCNHDNLLVEKCSGINLFNINSQGYRIRLIQLSKLTVRNLQNSNGSVVIHGTRKRKGQTKPLNEDTIALDGIIVFQGNLQIENATQIDGGHLHTYDSPNHVGIVLANINNMQVDSLISKNAQRSGIQLTNCQHLSIASVFIEADRKRFTSLEIGGGDASSISEDISIISGIYKNIEGRSDILLQTGEYALNDVFIQMSFNTLMKNKVWKNYRLNPDKARFKSIE